MPDKSGDPKTFNSLIVNIETVDFYDFEGHFPDENAIFSDKDNNVYYKFPNTVYQLHITVNGIKSKQYLPNGQAAWLYAVDNNGNCLYTDDGYNLKLMKPEGLHKQKTTTGIFTLENERRPDYEIFIQI